MKLESNAIVEPLNGQELTIKEKRAGIIADIHTDTVKMREFTASLNNRLADEDWQKKVYVGEGTAPAEDKWSKEIKK